MNTENLPAFLSASGMARRIDVPVSQVLKAVREQRLSPDATLPNRVLFHASRVREIKRALVSPTIVNLQPLA